MKSNIFKRISLSLGLLIASSLGLSIPVKAAGSVTVNLSSTKQIIRGYGAASAWCGALDDSKMNTLYSTMGLSILRVRIAPNDNWKSGDYSAWANELSNAKKAIARGAIVFATPWTPPIAMKTNGLLGGGGSLKTTSYAEYAEYLKAFANYFKNNGAPLYAISIQNEPDWTPVDEPNYESCKWTADQIKTFIHDYGQTISSLTKIITPESYGFNQAMYDPTLNDSTAASYVSIVGGHLYGAVPKDYPLARSLGKELWMTEHLFNDQTVTGCLLTAKEIHDTMVTGNMSTYMNWWIISDANGLYNKAGVVQKRGYFIGQWAKFVKNGYHRVDATSNPQTNVYVSAYTGDNKAVIVAVNNGTSQVSQQFTLQNGSTPSVSVTRTSATENMANLSSISASNGSFSATLPAQSVTTFVADINRFECEGMTLGGNSAGTTSSPFAGAVLYSNNDSCSFTKYFASSTHSFSVRGCSTTSGTARVDLQIAGKTVGSFYFTGTTPTVKTLSNVSHDTGSVDVKLVVTTDDGSWDTKVDYLEYN